MSACKNEPRVPYAYEQNPEYTYMGINFYGQYYDNIPDYVFSFTFLTEGMLSEDSTTIVAAGQYLYIEEFFVPQERLDILMDLEPDATEDIIERKILEMLEGEYKVSGKVGSKDYGNSFSFAPGEYFKVDSITYILGARITYYEKDDYYSVRKLITDGSFSVTETGVEFDFFTEDGQALKGIYNPLYASEQKKIKVKYSTQRNFEKK